MFVCASDILILISLVNSSFRHMVPYNQPEAALVSLERQFELYKITCVIHLTGLVHSVDQGHPPHRHVWLKNASVIWMDHFYMSKSYHTSPV